MQFIAIKSSSAKSNNMYREYACRVFLLTIFNWNVQNVEAALNVSTDRKSVCVSFFDFTFIITHWHRCYSKKRKRNSARMKSFVCKVVSTITTIRAYFKFHYVCSSDKYSHNAKHPLQRKRAGKPQQQQNQWHFPTVFCFLCIVVS